MKISAKAEYACLALLALAQQGPDTAPLRIREISESYGIPERYLVQILLQLKGAGLVASTRGAAGGYQLARPPEEIALADVLGVVDRADAPPARGRGAGRKGDTTPLAAALHGVWDKILTARQQILKQTTLAELVEAGHGLQYVI